MGSCCDALVLLDELVLVTLVVFFSTAYFFGFVPSGQVISVYVSTVADFTTGLVAAAAWA